MTDEQGLRSKFTCPDTLRGNNHRQAQVLNHNENLLNRPAVASDVKQSLPKCRVKGFFFLKSLQPLFRRNLPNELKQRETKKRHRNRRNAPGVIQRVPAKKNNNPKHPNTHFLVHQLLFAPRKKQQAESSHGTLERLLHTVSSR